MLAMKNMDYAHVFNSLQGLILVIDPELKLRAVSDGFLKVTGAKRDNLIGRKVTELFSNGTHETEVEFPLSLQQVLDSKLPHEMSVQRWVFNETQVTYWKPVTYPVCDEFGEIQFIIHETKDVTADIERELTMTAVEKELLEQTRLTDILDRQSDGFFILDRAYRFTYANKVLKQFGNLKDDVMGSWVKDLFPSPDHQKFLNKYEEVFSTGKPVMFTESYSGRILSVNAYPTMGGVAVFFRDVTETVKAQEEVHKSKDQLQLITDKIPAWIAYFDNQGRYQFLNKQYEDWFNIKSSDIIGKTREAFAPDSAPAVKEFERRALKGESIRFEHPVKKDGKTYVVDVSYLPDFDPITKNVRGATVIAYDITDKVENQERLEKALQMRDDFMSIASHELKTPLTSLALQNQFARKKLERFGGLNPDEIMKYIMATDGSMKRLNRLIDDMLDVSRISNGKLSFTPEKFDIVELAKEVLSRYKPHVNQLDLSYTGPVIGNWDRLRIDQVISNLVTNSIKYGKETPIQVMVEADHEHVIVSVKDHGPGIAKENHTRIFERFERETRDFTITGLGLGLFICKEIVERHNGKIWVHSEPGQGAKFSFKLPLL